MAWLNLEHQTYSVLKPQKEALRRVGLAVSGGLDSSVLLEVCLRVAEPLGWQFCLLHVHHGLDSRPEVMEFRDRAQELVEGWSRETSWPLILHRHKGPKLSTEEEYRDLRREFFLRAAKVEGLSAVFTAHHLMDRLETQILNLIRGCGAQGLGSLDIRSGLFFRPLIERSWSEIHEYAQQRGLRWLEDPTNRDFSESLRNWVRGHWLPQLDEVRPKAVENLARSMERVAREMKLMHQVNSASWNSSLEEWDLNSLLMAPREERVYHLVEGLRAMGISQFTEGQLQEVVKRLDNQKKEHTFAVRGLNWSVADTKVKVSRAR